MTKTKKITFATISVVMVGAMAMSMAACGKKDNKKTVILADTPLVDLNYSSGYTLKTAIGYNSSDTGLFYDSKAANGQGTIAGGFYMANAAIKPATQALQSALGITIDNSAYQSSSTANNLSDLVTNFDWGTNAYICTTDLSKAVTEAATNGTVLNLANYLDYMPHFKAFLQENPVVYLSVLQAGMDTTNGEGQVLYVAPYFDGMDDIEKGVLMRQDWIADLLDSDVSNLQDGATFKDVCVVDPANSGNSDRGLPASETTATSASATSYMGTSGSWEIKSTKEGNSDGSQTVMIKKDYDAARKAAASSNEALGQAYYSIVGSYYSGKSGNIVDIMNAAINAKSGDVNGKQLISLYKGYIDAAYSVDGAKAYGTSSASYSNLFTGYSACWDVDDLTAILRIVKTNGVNVGLKEGVTPVGIYPRDGSNSRTPDIVSLVGELYGVRGATSRYEQTYIDSNGVLQDCRSDERFWDALLSFGGLAKEGLVYNYAQDGSTVTINSTLLSELHGDASNSGYGFMQWDYSQTQTTQEFYNTADDDMIYGWVNTPVSKWNDGTKKDSGYSYVKEDEVTYKYMRFTDSWRSTKTSGVCVAATAAENPETLAACLTFVDYLYSNDGQIETTYAIQSTNGNVNPNGFWYGNKISNVETKNVCDKIGQYIVEPEYADKYVMYRGELYYKDLDENGNKVKVDDGTKIEDVCRWEGQYHVKEEYEGQYFAYGNEIYSGKLYKGKMTPIVTDELYNHFIDSSSLENQAYSAAGSFTNFARKVLGSTLPMCVKDQSFENQMTAEVAQECATRVSVSIGNGTINHCSLEVDSDNYWYTCMLTGLPYTNDYAENLSSSGQVLLQANTGTSNSDSDFWASYHHVIWYGFEGYYQLNACNIYFGGMSSSADIIVYLENCAGSSESNVLTKRISIMRVGWNTAKDYWESYLKYI